MVNNERLVGSVLTELSSRLFLLQGAGIQQVTAHNEIDFAQMRQVSIALFFCVPDGEMQRLRPLVSCFLLQMFAAWIRQAHHSPVESVSHPIVCYLDEFGTVGSLPRMADLIATLRSRRVALVLAYQNFAQLEERYGKAGAEAILANASTHLVLPGVGPLMLSRNRTSVSKPALVCSTRLEATIWPGSSRTTTSWS